MQSQLFYEHLCIKCESEGVTKCLECNGVGKKIGGLSTLFSKKNCNRCEGNGVIRCQSCAGMGKYKIYSLPKILGTLPENTWEKEDFCEKIVEIMNKVKNRIVDSENYVLLKKYDSGRTSHCFEMEDGSMVFFTTGGAHSEGFYDKNAGVQASNLINGCLNSIINQKKSQVRFIGRLLKCSLERKNVIRYDIQCFYMDIAKA